LSDQWALFSADTDARILRWLVREDERRMLETFFALESDERAAEHQDFFYALLTPFRDAQRHGHALRTAWLEQYSSIKPALQSEQLDASWEPPAESESDLACLLQTCSSFRSHYALEGLLVLVLDPSSVASSEQYQLWLGSFAVAAPPELRAIVIERYDAPIADTLAKYHPNLVKTVRAELDMPAALEEISREAGRLDTPGGQFRDLFVKLTNAISRRDLAASRQLGAAAVTLAESQSWFHLVVPVQIALGALWGSAGKHQEALAAYAAAEAAAVRGESECPVEARATCKQLLLQARLGRGLALINARAWQLAAETYANAAPLALSLENARTQLDCQRLASFCHEQHGDRDAAWQAGMEGLRVARAMDAETLATSTFAYLGIALVRLSQRATHRDIEREISEIAGTEDWRPQAQAQP
jgi:hypothetical protein